MSLRVLILALDMSDIEMGGRTDPLIEMRSICTHLSIKDQVKRRLIHNDRSYKSDFFFNSQTLVPVDSFPIQAIGQLRDGQRQWTDA